MKKLMITTAAVLPTATATMAASPLASNIEAELVDRGFTVDVNSLSNKQVIEIFTIMQDAEDNPFNNDDQNDWSSFVNQKIQTAIEERS